MCDNPCGADGGCSSTPGSKSQGPAQLGSGTQEAATCMKCRERPVEVLARQREPLCFECLASQLQSKVHGAIRARGVILPGDNVMVAFSGGAASAALLHLLAALRNPRTDRLERRKVAFSMHIVHVDELAAWGAAEEQAAAARAAVQQAAEPYLCEGVEYSCVRLEEVFAEDDPDQQQQQQRLQQLFQGVSDATGREDLVHHLRTRLLLATAAQLGCSGVARGDCATRLAAHIVAAASKGCGYGLPGDVQLVDARCSPSQPLFFLPLREVGRRELEALCQYKQLPTAAATQGVIKPGGAIGAPQHGGSSSINALAEGFVATLAAHNPGSVSNILATITKLQAFPWNDPPELHDKQMEARMKQRKQPAAQQQGQSGAGPSQPAQPGRPEVLCPICLAPLADDELGAAVPAVQCMSHEQAAPAAAEPSGAVSQEVIGNGAASSSVDAMPPLPPAACCYSCRSQILGQSPAPLGPSSSSSGVAKGGGRGPESAGIISLLPAVMQEQIRQLAAAENRAAEALAAAQAGQPGRQLRGAEAERLRAQIAEFLLED